MNGEHRGALCALVSVGLSIDRTFEARTHKYKLEANVLSVLSVSFQPSFFNLPKVFYDVIYDAYSFNKKLSSRK